MLTIAVILLVISLVYCLASIFILNGRVVRLGEENEMLQHKLWELKDNLKARKII